MTKDRIIKRCLIVEHDPTWHEQIRRTLESIENIQLDIESAKTYIEAIEKIRIKPFGLMLLDLSLGPKRTPKRGRELLVSLKTSEIIIPPTIIVSGTAVFDDVLDLMNNFRDCVIHVAPKQSFSNLSSRREFIQAVRAVLQDGVGSSGMKANGKQTIQSLQIVRNLCNNFPRFVRQLKVRWNKREGIAINDEYDVQDFFSAVLSLHFNDVRKEEWVPSYAGGRTRMDFLLKGEGIAIEVKMTRDGLTDKKLGEELLIDIGRYGSHPSCKTLVCFVFDPDGRIGNPVGLENDLNSIKYDDGIKIMAIISPKVA